MRLLDDMQTQAHKLLELSGLYRLTGDKELSRLATAAAYATAVASDAIKRFHEAEGEAINQAKEA